MTRQAELDFMDRAVKGDSGGLLDALVEMYRDPAQWFCSGVDPDGMPHVFGKGATQAEAFEDAHTAAADYRAEKSSYRVMGPLSAWRFPTYAPQPAGESSSTGPEQAFHYTTAAHLPWIIADGYLRASRHITRRPDGVGFVWFTTQWRNADRTSCAARHDPCLWLRFVVPVELTLPWRETCAAAGWTEREILVAARTVHWEVRKAWRVMHAPALITKDFVLQMYQADRWKACDAPQIELQGEVGKIQWGGRAAVVRRMTGAGPHGQNMHQIAYAA